MLEIFDYLYSPDLEFSISDKELENRLSKLSGFESIKVEDGDLDLKDGFSQPDFDYGVLDVIQDSVSNGYMLISFVSEPYIKSKNGYQYVYKVSSHNVEKLPSLELEDFSLEKYDRVQHSKNTQIM